MNASSKSPSPFLLYESAVQSPEWQVNYLPQFHRWLTGKVPTSMREDFCGSGRIACEWVKKSKKNRAVGMDNDREPLDYAEKVNKSVLSTDEKKRLTFLKQDVLKPSKEKFDFIGAYNFSFFIFHERKELLKYASAAYRSLKTKGTFFLEAMGGDGFMEALEEKRKIEVPGVGKVSMIWEQHQFDPITAVNDFSIHFKVPGDDWQNDVFRYHWRLWGIRDLQEILAEAGFKKSVVLWGQLDENGEETGEYLPQVSAEYQKAWIAYVIGVKG